MPLRDQLVRGREAVEAYRVQAAQFGDEWGEEQATTQLLYAIGSHVRFVSFNRQEEGKLGADWMWWWQAQSGEAYGMLVQAKRIKPRSDGWWFDFRYPKGSNRQISNLMEAAHRLDIAAAYVLYCGDGTLRRGFGCPGPHHDGDDCQRCRELAVAVVPALVVRSIVNLSQLNYPGYSAEDALNHALPVEDLPLDRDRGPVWSSLDGMSDEMRDFLATPQSGAREIAKALLRSVIDWRGLQHGALAPSAVASIDGRDHVFTSYPIDRGSHGYNGYFQMMLGGLRRELPAYVEQALASGQPPPGLGVNLAGVAVIEC